MCYQTQWVVFLFFKAELCVSICQASGSFSIADTHELKILPLEQFQPLRVGQWGNRSPPMVQSGVLYFVLNNKEGSNRF